MDTLSLDQRQALTIESLELMETLYKHLIHLEVGSDFRYFKRVEHALDKARARYRRRFNSTIAFMNQQSPAVILGALGGKSMSEAKRKASAENGKKGGRPRKEK